MLSLPPNCINYFLKGLTCTSANKNVEGRSLLAKQASLTCHIQGVSRLVDITAGGDFLGLCDQKSSYKHVSDFGWLRSYDHLKLRIEGNDF